jgi:hypothetical protein
MTFRTEESAQKVIQFYKVSRMWRFTKKYFTMLTCGLCPQFKDDEEYTMPEENREHGRRVYAMRAPEPGDIIWENVKVKQRQRCFAVSLIMGI